ncbi:hypothetical protein ACHAXH_003591, partial [Discostella pseudostelligera]
MMVESSFAATLFILMQLMSLMAAAVSQVQVANGECICSPRQFMFRLDFSGICPPLPHVFGAGVWDYTCYMGEKPDGKFFVDSSTSSTTTPSRSIRQRTQDGIFQSYNSTAPTSEVLSPTEAEWISSNFDVGERDPTPVVIYSIQIIEYDTSSNTVHIDDTHWNVEFQSGDVFCYTSFSEVDSTVIIGGMQMVLRGRNADSDLVMNAFTITYTNDCGVPTFQDGDAIGWVVFVSSPFDWFTSLGVCTSFPNPCIRRNLCQL